MSTMINGVITYITKLPFKLLRITNIYQETGTDCSEFFQFFSEFEI